jgi:phage gp46-like protein
MTDIALQQLDDGSFDVDIVGGDLLADNGMRTAVLISLFTDRVANADDVIPDGTGNRRGYWADAYSETGDRLGSRLWLLGRELETTATLIAAAEYADEALAWLMVDGVARSVVNVASWLRPGVLSIETTIRRSDSSLFQDIFNFSLDAL